MTEELVQIELGAAGVSYVLERLRWGYSLAHSVAERIERSAGEARAWVPAGTSYDRALRWDEGGLMSPSDGNRTIAALVSDLLNDSEGGVLIAENAMARVGDPRLEDDRFRFSLGTEVYEYRPQRSSSLQEIGAALRTADASYMLNAFVVSLPLPEQLPEFCAPASPSLEREIERIRLVIVRAYDGEGFAAWFPRPLD